MLSQLSRRLGLSIPEACTGNTWVTSATKPLAASWLPSSLPASLLQGLQEAQLSSSIGPQAEEQTHSGTSTSSNNFRPAEQQQQQQAAGVSKAQGQPSSSSSGTGNRGTANETIKEKAGSAPSSSEDRRRGNGGVSSGFRRVQSQQSTARGSLQGIIHINNSLNNIIVALTDMSGNLKSLVSAGQVGFKNARKSTPAAAERVADELARKTLTLGYTSVIVKMKGPGSNKLLAVQSLHAAGLRIKTLIDATGIPYNGCRAPKKRRI